MWRKKKRAGVLCGTFSLSVGTRVFHILGLRQQMSSYVKMHPRLEAVERKAISQGEDLFLLFLVAVSTFWKVFAFMAKYSEKH